MRRLLWALGLAVLGTGPTGASPLDVSLGAAQITVGDRLEVRIEARPAEDGSEPRLPLPFESWGEAEVLAAESLVFAASGRPDATPLALGWRIEVTAFAPGRVELPPLQLTSTDPESSAVWSTATGLGFEVVSVLPAEGEAEPAPPTPPQRLPQPTPWPWIVGAAGLVLVAAMIVWLGWRRRHGAIGGISRRPALTPFATLVQSLDALADLTTPEAFHVGLSLALRRYLEGSLGLPAPDRTCSEIQGALRDGRLSHEHARSLVAMLRSCDQVKFARLDVPEAERRRRLDAARALSRAIEAELERQRRPAPEVAA